MIAAGLTIGGLGLLSAFALGVVAKFFHVDVDPLVMKIEETLPGANCGGCGFPGCSAAAAAIARGDMAPNRCVGGGAEVHAAIAAILGVALVEREPEIAQVGCRYPIARADIKFDYSGVNDCRAAVLLDGGPKECPIGCLGLGSCVKACPFGALSMGPDHMPVVDEKKCTGCGTCVRTCPVGIMNLTSVSDRVLHEYTWSECTAPCQRRCPAGINIPEQIRQTALGNYEQALLVIKERNPFPLLCGRICPTPCEVACRRNLADEPVAINHLKRFVADYERTNGRRYQPYQAPATGHKVAVIGGGVQGLSAANFLARLGHAPTVFESRPKLGGILRTVIPENRLPREVLDWEIQGILDLGVEARTGQTFGLDFNLSELFDQDFEAVLIATGGWDTLLLGGPQPAPVSGLPGLYLLLPLTMAWSGGKDVRIGEKAAVVGGAREGLAMARHCLKKGAKEVTILDPNPRDRLGLGQEDQLQAAAEGVVIKSWTRVTELKGRGDALRELTYIEGPSVKLQDLALVEKGEWRVLEVDTIIVAAGRLPDMIIARDPDQEAEADQERPAGAETFWRTIIPYRASEGDRSWDLFYSPKPVSDFWMAVQAVGAGRRAAASINKLFNNEEIAGPENQIGSGPPLLDVDSLENLLKVGPRQKMPEASPEQRLDLKQETALGLSEESARAEAARCLNCGLICYYRTRYH